MKLHPKDVVGDLIAGTSVALVLVPQSLAYAELAGMPAYHGLYAAALAPVLAAFFASSKYLQTGPTAMTSLLTFAGIGTLAAPGGADFVTLAGLLALLVGIIRVVLGLVRGGALAFFLSPPVLKGFTVGAAVLIFASQIPTVLGAPAVGDGVLERAGGAVIDFGAWQPESIVIAALTLVVMFGGRKLHALFPGVLIAAVGATLYATYGDYGGTTVGAVPEGFLSLSLDLPWDRSPELIVPALVIAILGFAEPTAIARSFAATERTRWDANRELVSQGVANLASGVVGGFPVGGSFSRSSLSHLAGAKTRASGAITGLTVMCFLPFANTLTNLPKPVLGAIIIGAVVKLLQVFDLARIWQFSWPQATIAWLTFTLTLVLSPHIERAVLAGVGLSIAVHAWRELRVRVPAVYDRGVLTLAPKGVLWFASAESLHHAFVDKLARFPTAKRVALDLSGLGRIDYTGALAIKDMILEARSGGIAAHIVNAPPQTERILRRVCPGLMESDEA